MGCSASKHASNGSKKLGVFITGHTRTVNVEGHDSGRGSSAYTTVSGPVQDSAFSTSLRPPHHIPKMNSDPDARDESNFGIRGLVSNINTASKGIAYDLKVDHGDTDETSIIKSHPPKALRRLEVPQSMKVNYEKLKQDLQHADERKARLMKERREQCQSRRTSRNVQADTRRTSLEFRDYPTTMVTNVEIVHDN